MLSHLTAKPYLAFNTTEAWGAHLAFLVDSLFNDSYNDSNVKYGDATLGTHCLFLARYTVLIIGRFNEWRTGSRWVEAAMICSIVTICGIVERQVVYVKENLA